MRKLNLGELSKNVFKQVKDLPFCICKDYKPMAVVVSVKDYLYLYNRAYRNPNINKSIAAPETVTRDIKNPGD